MPTDVTDRPSSDPGKPPPGERFAKGLRQTIVDPYVRLFIPYYPRRDNPALARRCPGVKPLREAGLSFKGRRI